MTNYTGQFYQFSTKKKHREGDCVKINGPHDTWGMIIKITEKEDGKYLNLIRGVKNENRVKPVANF